MDFNDFRKALAADKAFAEKFAACKTPEALVEAAAREGYTFTVGDLKNNTEVSLEELKESTGGWVCDWTVKVIVVDDG